MIIFKCITISLSAAFGVFLALSSISELKNGNIPAFVGMVLMTYAYLSGIVFIL